MAISLQSPGLRVFAGLGNPGKQYEKTRHNIGFLLVDEVARQQRAKWKQEPRFQSLVASVQLCGQPVLLVKPQTFVNLSGTSVSALSRYYGWAPDSFVVAHDDINLDPGRLKVSTTGSAGGHNGVADILERLGDGFVRFRIGIGGKPNRAMDLKDWVLGRWTDEEEAEMGSSLTGWVEVLHQLFREGPVRAANLINSNKN